MKLLQDLLAPTCTQMLDALSNWLRKAENEMSGEDLRALLHARLAPDMFSLSTQVRYACVQAQEGVYRLRQEPFPPLIKELIAEGRNAAEHPGTIADAQARISETVAFLAAAAADTADVAPETPVSIAEPGMAFDLNAEQYVRDWALPQFYFHVTIAYAILRAQGVKLGKPDYVAHMAAYFRHDGAA